MALTPSQIQLLKSTLPLLETHGLTITTHFYTTMLTANPSLYSIFSKTNQVTLSQPRALAHALHAYISNISSLENLTAAVELICHKHASLYIQPAQYKIVGTYLLQSMATVLGDNTFTDEIRDAWAAAYWQLADMMIAREAKIYGTFGGWTDWHDFKVVRKVEESSVVTSFYLAPVDGEEGPLPRFVPGQYVSVQIEVPELGCRQSRQYSLSDAANPEYYRISVKRHDAASELESANRDQDQDRNQNRNHPGYVSTLLHSQYHEGSILQLSHPTGDFLLPPSPPSSPTSTTTTTQPPLILISAGVGLTPLLSMLNTLLPTPSQSPKSQSQSTPPPSTRPIHWIHTTHSTLTLPFLTHLHTLKSHYPNLRTTIFNTNPTEMDRVGRKYDFKGRMDLGMLVGEGGNKKDKDGRELYLGDESAEYFVCGPEGFMRDVGGTLKTLGVRGKVRFELFGTGGVE
ncbi:MAG: hypothetical protein M1834_007093 [Cirrosporium novae-zelandiae]|nr:MAG: hypothetical protein M1834_007093 [Cirrosporium novae-zelandiae]